MVNRPNCSKRDPRVTIKREGAQFRVVFTNSDDDWRFPTWAAAKAFRDETLERWDRVVADEAAGKPMGEGPEERTPTKVSSSFAGLEWLGI